MILAAIHGVPETTIAALAGEDEDDRFFVPATRAEWFKWIYGVREWTVSVSATETYPEGGGDPVPISDSFIAKAYQDNYIDGIPGLGDPQDDSRHPEIFEKVSGLGNPLALFDYRCFIGSGTTGGLIMSRAMWSTDGDDFRIYLRLNYSLFATLLSSNPYGEDYTLHPGLGSMTMGDKTWPLDVVVKDVPNETSAWWEGFSLSIEATKFWTWAEGYPSARFNETTGALIASPYG